MSAEVWVGSGGRGEGYGVAEGFELADVVVLLRIRVGLAGVVIGAQIVEPGVRTPQQVPDDDEDGAADSDDGAFLVRK